MFLVMFFLVGNIFPYGGDIRFADAENSVACLPSKIWAPFFANPTRGICFYDAGKFGRSLCRARTHEHVDVIGGAADDQRGPVHLSNNATEIGEQSRSKFRFDQRVAFASAEDKMEKDVAARMRHLSSAPQGWLSVGAPPTACAVGCILSPLRVCSRPPFSDIRA